MPEPVESVEPPTVHVRRPDPARRGVVRRALPDEAWERSVDGGHRADLAIVVGTSAIVYPAAGLPELALAEGIPVIEVNPERTPLSDSATICLRETAATALPRLLQRLPALLS